MQYYMSPEEAQYMDKYHGLFSKRMAEFAISKMKTEGGAPLSPRPMDELTSALKSQGVSIPEEMLYTAWYLYNMTWADYRKSLDTNSRRCIYIDETLNDPDGEPCQVLACFRAKMDVAGIPIHWEMMI